MPSVCNLAVSVSDLTLGVKKKDSASLWAAKAHLFHLNKSQEIGVM